MSGAQAKVERKEVNRGRRELQIVLRLELTLCLRETNILMYTSLL